MAWWLAAPVAIWAGKKLYDAVTEDDRPSRDYEAEARSRERRERQKLALSKARQTLRSYLEAQGVAWDSAIENRIGASELGSESGRDRLITLCQSHFAQSADQLALGMEIQAAEAEAGQPRLAQLRLRQLRMAPRHAVSAAEEGGAQ